MVKVLISLLTKPKRFNVTPRIELERDVDQMMQKMKAELVERREVEEKWGYLNIQSGDEKMLPSDNGTQLHG
ncbi:similar to mKIAA0738 protein (predicted), isoform CRA_c [Rattus norvegicus]|uniref:Similar to mKIAA0738 protein (Predicted), isoform CRA_c n=1 Tax=Rattus norvegicus TaxID=10116 RepID=A6IF85_RAT|nr:similar to mKIAA0738 protein (predicted), isoform CRA_c [Rattus norvegicus]